MNPSPIPTEESNADRSITPHVGGLVATSKDWDPPMILILLTLSPGDVHQSLYASQDVPGLQGAMTSSPSAPTPTCGLAGGLHCTLALQGPVKSIKLHLRKHGHRHPQRQVVQCPWVGCPGTLRWMNIPRHIQSVHLGVRFRCLNCGKPYTRQEGLAMHTVSLKCYGQFLLCIKNAYLPPNVFRRCAQRVGG